MECNRDSWKDDERKLSHCTKIHQKCQHDHKLLTRHCQYRCKQRHWRQIFQIFQKIQKNHRYQQQQQIQPDIKLNKIMCDNFLQIHCHEYEINATKSKLCYAQKNVNRLPGIFNDNLSFIIFNNKKKSEKNWPRQSRISPQTDGTRFECTVANLWETHRWHL